jgi:hypothetical protein
VFLSKHVATLHERYVAVSQIPEFEFVQFIGRTLTSHNHIFFGFDYDLLHSGRPTGVGHVGILLAAEGAHLDYYDPGPEGSGLRRVRDDELYTAIRAKSDGLSIIGRSAR